MIDRNCKVKSNMPFAWLPKLATIAVCMIGCFTLIVATSQYSLKTVFGSSIAVIIAFTVFFLLNVVASQGFALVEKKQQEEPLELYSLICLQIVNITCSLVAFVFILKVSKYICSEFFDLHFTFFNL